MVGNTLKIKLISSVAMKAVSLSALILFCADTRAWTIKKFSLNGFSAVESGIPLKSAEDLSCRPRFQSDIINLLFNYPMRGNLRGALDASWENGFDADRPLGRLNLQFGFLEYTITDEARLRGGILLTPFGLFNEVRHAKPAFHSIDVPLIYRPPRWFAPLGFTAFPAAATGFSIHGETNFDYGKELNYHVFLANGIQEKGTYPHFTDGNLSKSTTLRMRFFPLEMLRLGKSFYIDFPDDHVNRLLFSDGYELEITLGSYLLQVEGILCTRFPFKSVSENAQKQLGIAVHTAWNFSLGLTPYLRFEYLKPELNRPHNESTVTLAGVAWESSFGAMVKLETDYFVFGSKSKVTSTPGDGYMEVKAALIMAF